MKRNAPRGFALLLVLMVMIVLGTLTFAATALMRPSTTLLDQHQQIEKLQFAIDAALDASLADLDAGKPVLISRQILGQSVEIQDLTIAGKRELSLVAKSAGTTKALTLSLLVKATVAERDRRWRIQQYSISEGTPLPAK